MEPFGLQPLCDYDDSMDALPSLWESGEFDSVSWQFSMFNLFYRRNACHVSFSVEISLFSLSLSLSLSLCLSSFIFFLFKFCLCFFPYLFDFPFKFVCRGEGWGGVRRGGVLFFHSLNIIFWPLRCGHVWRVWWHLLWKHPRASSTIFARHFFFYLSSSFFYSFIFFFIYVYIYYGYYSYVRTPWSI